MIREIEAFDYAGEICKALPKGILLTVKGPNKVNSMTIGWGHIGVEWGKPIFVAYVRESRYTKEVLDGADEFTINVPFGNVDPQIIAICGRKSGRDIDKWAELGLTEVSSPHVAAPGIQELPLTLECKVIYRQKQEIGQLPDALLDRYYPRDEQGQQDIHIAYYGQIVGAYIAE